MTLHEEFIIRNRAHEIREQGKEEEEEGGCVSDEVYRAEDIELLLLAEHTFLLQEFHSCDPLDKLTA